MTQKRGGQFIIVFVFSIFLVLLFNSTSKADTSSIVDANNRFCFDMFSKLVQDKKTDNIFFSPFSISVALAMTYEGARGVTAKEIERVFYLPEDSKIRREGFLEMINEINKKDKKYQLHTANALWVEKDYKLLDDYLKTIAEYYQGKATNVGFIDNDEREQSRQLINKWVENQTNNKIIELIKPDMLDSSTRLVLTNAIYFKGNWQTQFNKSATKEEDFKVNSEKRVKVPMMSFGSESTKLKKFKYAETDDMQVLELPYEDNELFMLILLPKTTLSDVEKSLNYENLKQLKAHLRMRPVIAYMPKFKLEAEYRLGETLSKMGMPIAFSNAADFSGMDGTTSLKIGDVIHKAFVDVNEEGTEAAAATAVIMVGKGLGGFSEEPIIFRADHPFIFIIQHNKTGAILFMGRVYEPKR